MGIIEFVIACAVAGLLGAVGVYFRPGSPPRRRLLPEPRVRPIARVQGLLLAMPIAALVVAAPVLALEEAAFTSGVSGTITGRDRVLGKGARHFLHLDTPTGPRRVTVPWDAWRHCSRGHFHRAPRSLRVHCSGRTFLHANLLVFLGLLGVTSGLAGFGLGSLAARVCPRRLA